MEAFIDQMSKIENIAWFVTNSDASGFAVTAPTISIDDVAEVADEVLLPSSNISIDPVGVRRRKLRDNI